MEPLHNDFFDVPMNSLIHPKHGDKDNSLWFEEFPVKLLEDRDRTGLAHAAGVEENLRLLQAESAS
jgi:hypothetical protein